MTRLVELERLAYRTPLALRCRDATRRSPVGDGLVALAWPVGVPTGSRPTDPPAGARVAAPSPVSATLTFATLTGLPAAATAGYAPAGRPLEWPAPTPRAYVVRIVDRFRRYLTTVLTIDAPAPGPVEVDLYDAPTAPPPSGWAQVRGEVHRHGTNAPQGHAVVEFTADGTTYDGVCDELGRFALHVPYPEALPPLGVAAGTIPTWPVTIAVRAQPGHLARAPGTVAHDPPAQASILTQAAATIRLGGAHPSIQRMLRLYEPLVLRLPVDPG